MNENQQQLIAKATQSLNAAKYLYQGEYYDFAVARAYYTMFYVASAYLEGEGLSFSKHSAVISAFGREFAKTGRIPKEFHRHLKEAQDLRLLGDYGEINILDKEEAATQIERATAFLNLAPNSR
ncbi:HEPN domain-containing protein [Spirulina major CS-329]|uniref:HEPN domain-containing protein n=1 Tax=Spirulina TaxID=1154 RepID=UPI00232FD61D|nr:MULTISPECIES: HEPN domain-containing protein [Spirulina]MDB9494423.1 HEPN domain-containing protein [Spirulina subsalsa CS-330]MDB9502396.1 HEPN domain-containing protein [Spirulina major CS-329]